MVKPKPTPTSSSLQTLSKLTWGEAILRAVILLVTLPYHRFFTYNTLMPMDEILRHARRLHPLPPVMAVKRTASPESRSSRHKHKKSELDKLTGLLVQWSTRKKHELEFISIAGVAITAIVTASLSWGDQLLLVFSDERKPHWIGPAWWFASLILSVCGILLSAQQVGVLTLLGTLKKVVPKTRAPTVEDLEKARKKQLRMVTRYLTQLLNEVNLVGETLAPEAVLQDVLVEKPPARVQEPEAEQPRVATTKLSYKLSYKMMLTWQIPMMFLGYSFLSYFIGLTIIICTPLVRGRGARVGDPGTNIAITYLAVSAFAWTLFTYCSLKGYRPLPVDEEKDDSDDESDSEESD